MFPSNFHLRAALLAAICMGPAVLTAAEPVRNEPAAKLYDRLGGQPAVDAVVDQFLQRILADDRVNRWFAHAASDAKHFAAYKAKLTDFVCQATGGPCKYKGLDMEAAHEGKGVTPQAFDVVAGHLVDTLDALKVPEREKSQLMGLLAPMKPVIVEKSAETTANGK